MAASISYITQTFLLMANLIGSGAEKLLIFSDTFYLYANKRWNRLSTEDVEDMVIDLAHGDSSFLPNPKINLVRDVVRNLRAICKVDGVTNGKFLNRECPPNAHYIPLQNGILRILPLKGIMITSLFSHTSQFFATYVLPYRYSRRAGCPVFIRFLKTILSPAEIRLLQEWFGYNLIITNLAQKFMIFYGAGANGKSVISMVLKLLLGEENVSCLPLQNFLPNSRFGLAELDGKLANIVDEIDELDSVVATARIKSYVGGASYSIERKFQDTYQREPTARLTFSTNALPTFKDGSDGLMRRVMILPFRKQFLDESVQDKRLIDKKFWLENGELSGIFNWALAGLERLMANNWKFSEPESVREILGEYKTAINPSLQFLKDYVEVNPVGEIEAFKLYQVYCEHCKLYRIVPEKSSVFGRYIRREFSSATESKNALQRGKVRTRVWYGISFRKDSDTEPLPSRSTQSTHLETPKLKNQEAVWPF